MSEGCARKIRHDINQKLQILTSTEIPLLQSNGFNITAGGNSATISSNRQLAEPRNKSSANDETSLTTNVSEEMCKRPGRDSNPGRRSDSPPYWTGLHDSGFSLRSNQVSLYYPGARKPTFCKTN